MVVVESSASGVRLWAAPQETCDDEQLLSALAMAGRDSTDAEAWERWRTACFDADDLPRTPWREIDASAAVDQPWETVVVCSRYE